MDDTAVKLAGEAGNALAEAVKSGDRRGFLGYETAIVKLHRRIGGHYPHNGRSLEGKARRELRVGKPGEGCKAFAEYLKGLSTSTTKTESTDKVEAKAPAKKG